jgi:8-amino-7-oxononanoate synthase
MDLPKSAHSDFWKDLESELLLREQAGLKRQWTLSEPESPRTIVRSGQSLVHFGSNDYLSLAWHPAIRHTVLEYSKSSRFGSSASPLISGAGEAYQGLVQALAAWENAEQAMAFSSGYAANLGTIGALVTKNDAIASDALNHACLIDGCRLSRASVHVYPHADMDALRSLLKTLRPYHRRLFVVTDTVFSMDGDLAPVQHIQNLCEEFDAMVIADEAHASGVLGEKGRGLAWGAGIDERRWVRTGTLSKAIGCSGGFVAGSTLLIDWLTQRARSWIYSTAPPAASWAAATVGVQLASSMDLEREHLAIRSKILRAGLARLGYITRTESTPIVPVYFRSPQEVLAISKRLQQEGFFVPAIRPPTVPRDSAMLRISLTAAHSLQDIEDLLAALERM